VVERRQSVRHGFQTALALVRNGEPGRGEARDISAGGLRLRVEGAPLVAGETFDVTFSLPDLKEPVTAECEVRWVDRIDTRSGGVGFRQGLRAREVWAIERLPLR
jgi:hypothetical protein